MPGWDLSKVFFFPTQQRSDTISRCRWESYACVYIYLYMCASTNGCNGSLGLANNDIAAMSQRAGRWYLLQASLAMVDRSLDAVGVAQASGPILRATAVASGSLGAPRFPWSHQSRTLPGSGCCCKGSWSRCREMLLEKPGLLRLSPGCKIPAPHWETCPGRAPHCKMGLKHCLHPIIHSFFFFFLAPTLGTQNNYRGIN